MAHIYESCRPVAVMIAVCFSTSLATAADEPAAAKPRQAILCPECGMVYNIRRVEKPVAPERETLPSITSSSRAGGVGGDTQPVPLFSFGRDGPQRVPREPTTRSVWEITVRYDNGQFGFVTRNGEPDFEVGDRVRVIENTLELIPQPAR